MSSAFYSLLRPALFRLDAERAHSLAIAALERLPRRSGRPDDPRLATAAFGLSFPNPVGMAAGFDKDARVPDQLLSLGFGFAEAGTLTPKPQAGNPRPRLFRIAGDRAVINRLGFNNAGHAAALGRLTRRPAGPGVLGINIGANKDTSDRIADYVAGVTAFAPHAAYLTVNISSPNTPGLRDLQGPAALDDLLSRVMPARDEAARALARPVPVIVKLAPDIADDDLPAVIARLLAHRVDGAAISNTTLSRSGLYQPLAAEAGGLSGRPLFVRSTRLLARAYLVSEGRLPLVGIGGIDSGEAAIGKIEAGATLLQLYSGLVYEGPGLVGRIKRSLIDWLDRSGAACLDELRGRRAGDWAARSL
jgi:dihydroorotate dehydrogenase